MDLQGEKAVGAEPPWPGPDPQVTAGHGFRVWRFCQLPPDPPCKAPGQLATRGKGSSSIRFLRGFPIYFLFLTSLS